MNSSKVRIFVLLGKEKGLVKVLSGKANLDESLDVVLGETLSAAGAAAGASVASKLGPKAASKSASKPSVTSTLCKRSTLDQASQYYRVNFTTLITAVIFS
jgi:hypothetical protein